MVPEEVWLDGRHKKVGFVSEKLPTKTFLEMSGAWTQTSRSTPIFHARPGLPAWKFAKKTENSDVTSRQVKKLSEDTVLRASE